MQGIKISLNYVGTRLDIALIQILGYVDTTTCQEVTKVIQELIGKKQYQIVSDLGSVTYISSAGWGVFVGELKNIREKGGDLKIVRMSPEVLEVFEMLEFNRILNYYESIEEAINEFDIIRGIDITKMEGYVKQPPVHKTTDSVKPSHKASVDRKGHAATVEMLPPKIPVADLPLIEKVKLIVVENPTWGTRTIRKQLHTEKYGSVRMGWFRTRSLLSKLDLETREKRYRFYRSR
ncbi:MAG: STAS domain-containing protein [bacterium]